MGEFLQSRGANAVSLLAATAALIAVGIYLIGKVRADVGTREPGPNDLLTNFRELHEQGQLNDEEYRNIKTRLAGKLQQELSEESESG